MIVGLETDRWGPFILSDSENAPYTVEVSEDTFKQWKEISKAYKKMQEEMWHMFVSQRT